MDIISISRTLCEAVDGLRFGSPVTHVYNPLVYAQSLHEAYLQRFGRGEREVVLLGMNPGPWGMAQTGVPFGEVGAVRDWMGLDGQVLRPVDEHPKRPVTGLQCPRSEVSGARLWGWAKALWGSPERFFERFFVLNHCPLVFMEASGRNYTPNKLPSAERRPLLEACDHSLRQCIETLRPKQVIGVGAYAEERARIALAGMGVSVGRILHPSPASPAANRGWAPQASAQLQALGIELPCQG